jgi:hypothetical protein
MCQAGQLFGHSMTGRGRLSLNSIVLRVSTNAGDFRPVCSHARGVTDADLAQWGAKFGNPTIVVPLVEWADRIITE